MMVYVKLKKKSPFLIQKSTPPILSQLTGSLDNLETNRFVSHQGKKTGVKPVL